MAKTVTAIYHQAGEVEILTTYGDGGTHEDHVGYYDADGGEWDEPVRAMLRKWGVRPVGEWVDDEDGNAHITVQESASVD